MIKKKLRRDIFAISPVVFDIVFRRYVDIGELTDVIKYAAVPFAGLVSSRPQEFALPSQTCKVRTTEEASPNFANLVLRNGFTL